MTDIQNLAGTIGYGAMSLSIEGRPERDQAIEVILQVLEQGVRLIDTADCYCLGSEDMHHNEELIAEALRAFSGDTSKISVATKGGITRPNGAWKPTGDPEYLRRTIFESAEVLGKPIALWQHHAPDSSYAVEISLEPVVEAVSEGLIERVGVSNYSVDQLHRAREVLPIVSVQNKYNLWHRRPEQDGMLEYCTTENVTFIPWSPLGGRSNASSLEDVEPLQEIAQGHQATPAQIVLAWLLQKSPVMLPIPSSRSVSHIKEAQAAAEIQLESSDVQKIDALELP